ncbi:MAG: redox-sensing transcriptional repressor Rex [Acidimicrobiales bacterium]
MSDQVPDLAGGEGARVGRRVPEATVARLPVYLRALMEVADPHAITISSERLAEMVGVNAAKVRKDLSHLGSYGTRGVGYEVDYLVTQISRVLGLTQDWPVVIVGVGNLGHALAKYRGFAARGFRVVALVDADANKVGERLGGLVVRHLDDLPRIAVEESVAIGIIATPAVAAQDVADRLVDAGVSSILNFAPTIVTVPKGVSIRKVDLSIELQILSFYQQRRATDGRIAHPPGPAGPRVQATQAGPRVQATQAGDDGSQAVALGATDSTGVGGR